MSQVLVGRWGKNLAVRVPMDVAAEAGLREGEAVTIEIREGDILIRRDVSRHDAREAARTAAAEIIAESRRHSLRGLSIKDLLSEGRRI